MLSGCLREIGGEFGSLVAPSAKNQVLRTDSESLRLVWNYSVLSSIENNRPICSRCSGKKQPYLGDEIRLGRNQDHLGALIGSFSWPLDAYQSTTGLIITMLVLDGITHLSWVGLSSRKNWQ